MKLSHYILIGSVAVVSCGTAAAADLPVRKAAPVEYVRVCDAFGEGFFYIPGSDTCLRVGGQMRAEFTGRANAPYDNLAQSARNLAGNVYNRDLLSFRARGYLNVDARTQTAYGAVRTFVTFRISDDTTNTGPYGGGSYTPPGSRFSEKTSLFQGFAPGAQTILDKAFIQFAGVTAGRAQSFFDFDAQSYELLSNSLANSNQLSELLAYTATFGGGFSATLSVEDAVERRIADNGFLLGLPGTSSPTATRAAYQTYAGEEIPDIVGNLRYDAAWGALQISAAYHQVSSAAVTLNNGAGPTVTPPDRDGFAVQGGAKFLLPTLAKGDSITFQGVYEEGAMDYVNPLNYQPNGLSNIYSHGISVSLPVNDAFVLPNGTIGLNKAWGGYGAFRHYWVPTVYSSVYGDYLSIRNPASAQRLGAGADNAEIFQVGFNTIWVPVKDFQIGAEVLYSNMKLSGLANLGTTPRNPDDFRGRLSIRRAF